MANISRRRFLGLAGAGAAAAVVLPPPQIALAAAPGDGGTGALLANIVGSLAGTAETNAATAVQPKLLALYDAAKSNLAALIANPTDQLFPGLALGTSDPNLMNSYRKLFEIAIATAMPLPAGTSVPADISGNTEVQDRVIDALGWLYDNYLEDQSKGYYGNWYNWEIAIPQYASKALALLADRLTTYRPDLAASYVQTLDLYLRSGKDGDVDLDSRFDTGANLADMTTNRIVQGAVIDNSARITKAIADQMTVYRTIDPYNLQHGVTDGFYADGSYLQHSSVAYTGSYGVTLLRAATETIGLLAGTEFATDSGLVTQINTWLTTSFAPTIAYGWLMEMVKGRAVSRTTTGYSNTVQVIEPTVALSQYASPETAASLKSYIKYLEGISTLVINPASFQSPANILQYGAITSDTSIRAADLLPSRATFAFNAMDRNVHRRPGFMFALSRSSSRISKYEYMSGENLMPWFQGDGMSYLYLDGDDQSLAYGVDYFTTVSPYQLSGVTTPVEERKTIPQLYGEQFYDNPPDFTSSSVNQNLYVYFPVGTDDYSGSTHLDEYATAAWVQSDDAAYAAKQVGELPADFVAYADSRATKSWFMLDDEIVVLLAGVGDEHGRDVLTTLDSRIAAPGDAVTVTAATAQRQRISGPGAITDPAWVLYTNATRKTSVGYAFLGASEARIQLADVRRRALRTIRQQNADKVVSKTVFSLSVTHPAAQQPGSLAYAIVPSADETKLGSYTGDRGDGPSIVANSTRVQAIRHKQLGLLSANVFAPSGASVGPMTFDGPASLIARKQAQGRTTIAVSDPTFARDRIQVVLQGHHDVLGSHPGVTARQVPTRTRLTFDTHQLYGATVSVTVRGNLVD